MQVLPTERDVSLGKTLESCASSLSKIIELIEQILEALLQHAMRPNRTLVRQKQGQRSSHWSGAQRSRSQWHQACKYPVSAFQFFVGQETKILHTFYPVNLFFSSKRAKTQSNCMRHKGTTRVIKELLSSQRNCLPHKGTAFFIKLLEKCRINSSPSPLPVKRTQPPCRLPQN